MAKRQRRLKRGYAALNRNLCNYPLARDPRVRARWRRSARTGRWLCDLPGDGRIQFRLPADSKQRRCPSIRCQRAVHAPARVAGEEDRKVEFASHATSFLRSASPQPITGGG